ncbi:MAG: hypothetical protein LUE64_03010, partial [Candidatus Gastranaerophilales bacterium]|nr:hypothetical protein [Candidatus Gastranaerophilales bacterium]
LECIKRAFELAVNYTIISGADNKKISNLHFDTNLLIKGKRETLKEKYQKVKEFEDDSAITISENSHSKKNENKPLKKQKTKKQIKKTSSKTDISKNKNILENNRKLSKKEQKEHFFINIIYLILVVLALSVFLFILPF